MTNTIDIWRIEEIMKVTIHELYHLFHCDKSMNDDYNIINFYHKRYNINSERVNTFEAYTEICTLLKCMRKVYQKKCIDTYIHIYIYIYICVYMYMYKYTHIYVYMYI